MSTSDDLVSLGLMALAAALLIVVAAHHLDKALSRRKQSKTDAKRHQDH